MRELLQKDIFGSFWCGLKIDRTLQNYYNKGEEIKDVLLKNGILMDFYKLNK
jgi:hypothetical protein